MFLPSVQHSLSAHETSAQYLLDASPTKTFPDAKHEVYVVHSGAAVQHSPSEQLLVMQNASDELAKCVLPKGQTNVEHVPAGSKKCVPTHEI